MKIVIVGTGVSGTATLVELAHQIKNKALSTNRLSIVTIEERAINGPGYAYDPRGALPTHLLNQLPTRMSTQTIDRAHNSIDTDFEFATWSSYDFLYWMQKNRSWIMQTHPDIIRAAHPELKDVSKWVPDKTTYYGRMLYGIYLQDSFKAAVRTLRDLGVHVEQYNRTRVVDIDQKEDCLCLYLVTEGITQIVEADKVLLATGRWQNRSNSKAAYYFDSPFPAKQLLEKIEPTQPLPNGKSKRIIVQGMGLSGVDTILSFAAGRFYRDKNGQLRYRTARHQPQIIAVSRNGQFSVVKDQIIIKPQLQYFTAQNLQTIRTHNNGQLTLGALKLLIEKELEFHLKEKVDLIEYAVAPKHSAFQKLSEDMHRAKHGNIIYGIFQQILAFQLFSQLRSADKQLFIRHIRRYFLKNIAAMPYATAEKLMALHEAGVLKVVRMGFGGSRIETTGPKPVIRCIDGDLPTIEADYVIRASGDTLDAANSPDELLTNLLAKRLVLANRVSVAGVDLDLGGIKVDPLTFAVISAPQGIEVRSERLYAFGMHVMNWAAERDFALASLGAAKQVVAQWTRCMAKSPARSVLLQRSS